tara:strand:+ start:344 stop:946 length:603 start_codon:yes stop_codon:yes gene_type:complete
MRSLLNFIGRRERVARDTDRDLMSVNPIQQAENAATQMRQTNAIYTGQYDLENRKHGKGVLVLRNGHTFIGQWEHGKFNGEGGHIWNGNRIFYGQWKEGKADGEGVHKCFNGDKYIGQFKNNKMHGVGRYTYKNGTEYYGQWEYNKPNGQGILLKKHGNYQGEWKDSKKHGNGVYENFITEKIYTQRWFNDQKIGDERVF